MKWEGSKCGHKRTAACTDDGNEGDGEGEKEEEEEEGEDNWWLSDKFYPSSPKDISFVCF